MGTRSITIVRDKNDKKIIEMYKQYDGYPDGFGQELQNFINSGTMVNGIGSEKEKVFNGISCFTAQLVEYFKDGAGGIYLHTPTGINKNKKKYSEIYSAEYVYEIDHNLKLRCWDTYSGKEIFDLKEENND